MKKYLVLQAIQRGVVWRICFLQTHFGHHTNSTLLALVFGINSPGQWRRACFESKIVNSSKNIIWRHRSVFPVDYWCICQMNLGEPGISDNWFCKWLKIMSFFPNRNNHSLPTIHVSWQEVNNFLRHQIIESSRFVGDNQNNSKINAVWCRVNTNDSGMRLTMAGFPWYIACHPVVVVVSTAIVCHTTLLPH